MQGQGLAIAYDFPTDSYTVDTADYEQVRLWAAARWVQDRTGIPLNYHEAGEVVDKLAGVGDQGVYALTLVVLLALGQITREGVPMLRAAYPVDVGEE